MRGHKGNGYFRSFVKLDFFEVDQGRWPDFEKLFERRGGPKNCWCMVWRGKPEDRKNMRVREVQPLLKLTLLTPTPQEFGFVEVGTAGSRRHVMRFMLDLFTDCPVSP